MTGGRKAHSAEQTQREWGHFPTQLVAGSLLQPSRVLQGRGKLQEGLGLGPSPNPEAKGSAAHGHPLTACAGHHQTQGDLVSPKVASSRAGGPRPAFFRLMQPIDQDGQTVPGEPCTSACPWPCGIPGGRSVSWAARMSTFSSLGPEVIGTGRPGRTAQRREAAPGLWPSPGWSANLGRQAHARGEAWSGVW